MVVKLTNVSVLPGKPEKRSGTSKLEITKHNKTAELQSYTVKCNYDRTSIMQRIYVFKNMLMICFLAYTLCDDPFLT